MRETIHVVSLALLSLCLSLCVFQIAYWIETDLLDIHLYASFTNNTLSVLMRENLWMLHFFILWMCFFPSRFFFLYFMYVSLRSFRKIQLITNTLGMPIDTRAYFSSHCIIDGVLFFGLTIQTLWFQCSCMLLILLDCSIYLFIYLRFCYMRFFTSAQCVCFN